MSLAWLAWWLPPVVYRTVIVNLVSDPDVGLRGVMMQRRGAWLVLRKVHAVRANAEPAPVDGDVLIHRVNVSFIQALP